MYGDRMGWDGSQVYGDAIRMEKKSWDGPDGVGMELIFNTVSLFSADLHMAQLMPLPLTVSCFSKIQ